MGLFFVRFLHTAPFAGPATSSAVLLQIQPASSKSDLLTRHPEYISLKLNLI
jgi:hypothetical protein